MPLYQARNAQDLPYLFVDDGNVSAAVANLMGAFWPNTSADLDWNAVARLHHKVFVYSALPVQKANETFASFETKLEQARLRLQQIGMADDTHVRNGLTRAEGRRGTLRQKAVDIQLAVDALAMAHRGLFQRAVIWTSDLDFLPLLEELVLLGVTVTLWYQPGETAEELKIAADRAEPMLANRLYSFLRPDFRANHAFPETRFTPVPLVGGAIITRWPTETGHRSGYIARLDDGFHVVWPDFDQGNALEIQGSDILQILKLAQIDWGLTLPQPIVDDLHRQHAAGR